MTVPAISVIIATYNGENYLREQLDSILAQSITPSEIIVVDDGSTDQTYSLLEHYASNNNRFRVIRNDINIGYIRTFEKGMQLATCPFIALSDQDDIWFPHKLESLYAHLGNNLLIYSNSELVDAEGKKLGKKMSDIRNQLAYNSCLMYTIGSWAPGHAMMFKKELLSKCLPFPAIVTHDFWLGFVACCYSDIQYLDEALVYYRQHSANAIGANTGIKKKGKSKPSRKEKLYRARERMQLLFEKCPPEKSNEKAVLKTINESYQSFSIRNNLIRMVTFFRYRHLILAYKRKSSFMKILFCIKMFFKID